MSTPEPGNAAAAARGPRIIYGTAWKAARTAELVREALVLGFRALDTAGQPRHYDEAGVGAGLAAAGASTGVNRADLYLQTKYTPPDGQDPKRIPYDPGAPPAVQVAQSFESSLRNLRTDYLDCLILHSPIADRGTMEEVWQAMEAIAAAGGARQLGISNCYSRALLEALHRSAAVKPTVVQNRFYAETGHDRTIRAFCREQGLTYQSFWTLTANPQLLAHAVLRGLAASYGRTPAQVLFRYLTQEGVVPLTGTTSSTHMREDLQIFEFSLTDDERARVSALL